MTGVAHTCAVGEHFEEIFSFSFENVMFLIHLVSQGRASLSLDLLPWPRNSGLWRFAGDYSSQENQVRDYKVELLILSSGQRFQRLCLLFKSDKESSVTSPRIARFSYQKIPMGISSLI